jgi:hypothetical protein
MVMQLGKINSYSIIADIFSYFGHPGVNSNALRIIWCINKGYRHVLIENFDLIHWICLKGEPGIDKKILANGEYFESETTVKRAPGDKGLTWVVKERVGGSLYVGGNFGASYKLEKVEEPD